jgi:hypothetical protein
MSVKYENIGLADSDNLAASSTDFMLDESRLAFLIIDSEFDLCEVAPSDPKMWRIAYGESG